MRMCHDKTFVADGWWRGESEEVTEKRRIVRASSESTSRPSKEEPRPRKSPPVYVYAAPSPQTHKHYF
ncbi:hypothetical protein NECAME_01858 [Necator americanus]|uniref:Uncharacterized protein n=1 Tax=Necator americanus TaxID=51031 RepID=W2TN17_NECAM|nr:hypothetical protein NECAME_01858 [Necator americanus]ETN83059.1 hypothetical protein NECAME_01858 [Necator americanus]